jgi:hypothetical protein
MAKRVFENIWVVSVVVLMAQAAAVNCDQVRRYLATGRSAEDVADTMVVSLDEVKKCQQAGEQKAAEPAGAKPEEKPAPKQ